AEHFPGTLIAGKCPWCAAGDHARQLVKQQDQRQPALRGARPILQAASKDLRAQIAEALTRLAVLLGFVAGPQAVLLLADQLRRAARAEPPDPQPLPR